MIRNFINKLFNLNKESETKEGVVKFFNAKKGFGFITLDDSKEEIFVHTTNVVGKIREKNKVFGINCQLIWSFTSSSRYLLSFKAFDFCRDYAKSFLISTYVPLFVTT